MSTVEIKKLLIHRIEEINDLPFLNALKTILEAKTHSQVISLTKEQYLEIVESKKEIERGDYIEQSDLDKEIEKWLSVK